ncbi:MAG: hypothetical protein M5U28_26190 [Sandaracinaceae bacterium]|nr:hypothetical protein [Sandaracinaceae bacterium]
MNARSIAATALLLAACAQFDTGSVARRRAAEALECEEESVEVTAIGEYRFRGEGCGRTATVTCTAGALEPQCFEEAELLAAGGEAEPAPDPEVAGEVEARIRAGLEARREDVLECVGRDRVAVRVGYAPDGTVEIALSGALHDTPEERCVQDALEGVRVAATGASGVVVHLVR